MEPHLLQDHVALVTGGNHGIGAATARVLAECGAAVLISYLRIPDAGDPTVPALYRENRALDAAPVMAAIESRGGRVRAIEADLTDVHAAAQTTRFTTPLNLQNLHPAEPLLPPLDSAADPLVGAPRGRTSSSPA
jgi:NAD(P)-dependent dehydrogenase (short-subunit alcohol dehydrogenase family)